MAALFQPVATLAASGSDADQVTALSDQVGRLSAKVHETKQLETLVLAPLAVLVSILAAGGALGIVFSVRDQRRVSQLHELTVGGEVSAQRRTEQGYASFFEQSQTTLSLVNDTLELAKEANENATRTMKSKAQSRVDEIEERAQRLMFDAFGEREFEVLIKDPVRLAELEAIAEELRSLEGYLSLQNIKLPPYTKFIKALDQFLRDDAEAALQALQLASQDGVVADLQRFIEYWLGYICTTVGDYEEAITRFRHDELELRRDDPEYLQLERIIAETEFFAIAKPKARDRATGHLRDPRGPRERFEAVAKLLDRLAALAAAIEDSTDERAKVHTSQEVARTRADIFEWVAYDPRHLDDPLRRGPIKQAVQLDRRFDSAERFIKTRAWAKLRQPDVVRAWALRQACAICKQQEERSFDVEFALAECYFKLRDKRADTAFDRAERIAHEMVGEHHEKRTVASLQESLLICHSRLLKLRGSKKRERKAETRQVRQVSRDALEAVGQMRQLRVTVFSQIQRRNVTQEEFKDEIREIVEQDHLREGDT